MTFLNILSMESIVRFSQRNNYEGDHLNFSLQVLSTIEPSTPRRTTCDTRADTRRGAIGEIPPSPFTKKVI